MPSNSRNNLVYAAITALVFISAFFKIVDLDFWWHLKTGQIILQQKAFQYHEIYSFTAAGREYIDHEWLFQVMQFFAYSHFGPAGVILLKCAVFILIYLLLARYLLHYPVAPLVTFGILLVSIAGARTRFIERPEIFTTLFLVCSYLAIDRFLRTGSYKSLLIIPPMIVVWSNFHAAVILGLVLQAAFIVGSGIDKFEKRKTAILVLLLVSSLLLTAVNPYGFRVLKVPFELTSIIDSGLLHNQEWQHPTPFHLPFFYLCLFVTWIMIVLNFRKIHVTNLLLSAFFTYIALKYLRNIGIFSVMMPLLVAPYLSRITVSNPLPWLAGSLAFVILSIVTLPYTFGIGISPYFPEKIVQFTETKNLQGNMINSYGFGGYLIWRLYPERRIFIDGRNEVFLPLLQKLIQMREDSRSWIAFLKEYQIEYALLNYVDTLETVTLLDRNGNKTISLAPFSSTHFPRNQWALVYWDDTGMILVKRSGINSDVLSSEYRAVYPEGTSYEAMLAKEGKLDVQAARSELTRKLTEDPNCTRAKMLLQSLQGYP
jgi:hypothetical protein